jgi:hypothetical protein
MGVLEIDRCDRQAIQYLYAGIRFEIRREILGIPHSPSVQISDTCDLAGLPGSGPA